MTKNEYSISIKRDLFIAHSLDHPDFGPARNLHGATLNISVTVFSSSLNEMNAVMDIGELSEIVAEVFTRYNYKNLDTLEEFEGELTTIEFLCKYLFDLIVNKFGARNLDNRYSHLTRLAVRIDESSTAWAVYRGELVLR